MKSHQTRKACYHFDSRLFCFGSVDADYSLGRRQALRNSAGLSCGCHVTTTGDDEAEGAANAAPVPIEASLPLLSQPGRHAAIAIRPAATYQGDFSTASPRLSRIPTTLQGARKAECNYLVTLKF